MHRKNIIQLIIISTMLLTGLNSIYAKNEENNMLSKKPFVQVHFATAGCTREVLINDVPILDQAPSNLPFDAEYPINQWLRSGTNTITLRLTPNQDANDLAKIEQQCKGEINLLVGQYNNKDKGIAIGTIKYQSSADNINTASTNIQSNLNAIKLDSTKMFEPSDNGDVTIGTTSITKISGKYGPGIQLQRTIDLPLPFPIWSWFKSDLIQNNESTQKALVTEYQKIWDSLKNKKTAELSSLFDERNKEYQAALYNDAPNILSSLQTTANNSNYELGDFIPKYEYLHVFGQGKLAKLTTWDGHPSIYFNEKKGDTSESFDLIFRKQHGKWIVTR